MISPRARLCSAMSWLRRERNAPALDRFVRRGGGLFVLVALSFLAGWLLPDPRTVRAFLHDSEEPCLRIVWVARITTGGSGEPGPILLVQTAWTRDARESPRKDEDPCRSSKVLLRLPPADDSLYHRRDGLLVPLRELPGREPPRLPIPPELCLSGGHGRPGLTTCQETK